jgi:hypothetical protein
MGRGTITHPLILLLNKRQGDGEHFDWFDWFDKKLTNRLTNQSSVTKMGTRGRGDKETWRQGDKEKGRRGDEGTEGKNF